MGRDGPQPQSTIQVLQVCSSKTAWAGSVAFVCPRLPISLLWALLDTPPPSPERVDAAFTSIYDYTLFGCSNHQHLLRRVLKSSTYSLPHSYPKLGRWPGDSQEQELSPGVVGRILSEYARACLEEVSQQARCRSTQYMGSTGAFGQNLQRCIWPGAWLVSSYHFSCVLRRRSLGLVRTRSCRCRVEGFKVLGNPQPSKRLNFCFEIITPQLKCIG